MVKTEPRHRQDSLVRRQELRRNGLVIESQGRLRRKNFSLSISSNRNHSLSDHFPVSRPSGFGDHQTAPALTERPFSSPMGAKWYEGPRLESGPGLSEPLQSRPSTWDAMRYTGNDGLFSLSRLVLHLCLPDQIQAERHECSSAHPIAPFLVPQFAQPACHSPGGCTHNEERHPNSDPIDE